MEGLKASWQVIAGLIPAQPLRDNRMPEYDRTWIYTSSHYATDGGTQEGLRREGSLFRLFQTAAHEYAAGLQAGGLNWVETQYLWL